jgi:hypothetical protein
LTRASTLKRFIVRIYRTNTKDDRRITGLVEAMDGSGEREAFAGIDELGAILNRRAGKQRKRRKKSVKSGVLKMKASDYN